MVCIEHMQFLILEVYRSFGGKPEIQDGRRKINVVIPPYNVITSRCGSQRKHAYYLSSKLESYGGGCNLPPRPPTPTYQEDEKSLV